MDFHIKSSSRNYIPYFLHFSTIKGLLVRNNDPNTETIATYNDEYQKYLHNTPTQYPKSYQPMLDWISTGLSYVKPGGKVLEIGSATPRDARFIHGKGFEVQLSDAAPNFVKYMNEQGEPAILLNVLKDKITSKYDMVFANAVFPHFTNDEILIALKNIHEGLSDHGIVCFNVKQGQGEDWIKEKSISRRYINYQQPENIRKLVEQSNFEMVTFEENCIGDPPTHIWTRVVARKLPA